ncbi:MAG: uracil-DNA glycosylase [Deltaproteobacteria bacterium]|nr:uracil-DNA glycosylase [Deltaproteobacteria bacterium]
MMIHKLNDEIRSCRKCRLCDTRIHALCGEGNLKSKLMIIAQAPGENEDREGKMFIGPSGKVLDELLEITDISRTDIYMTDLIKCMLPRYRRSKQDEIKICRKYLNKEIDLIDPSVISSLGFFATRYLFHLYGVTLPPKPGFHEVYGKLFFSFAPRFCHSSSRSLALPENEKNCHAPFNYFFVLHPFRTVCQKSSIFEL